MLDPQRTEAMQVFGGDVSVSRSPYKSFDADEFRDRFRARIARVIVFSFLAGIGIILIGGPVHNFFVDVSRELDTLRILTTYAGVLGPFVGVISGYYFKN